MQYSKKNYITIPPLSFMQQCSDSPVNLGTFQPGKKPQS